MKIEIQNLSKQFDQQQTAVLRGIDFSDEIRTMAVIGPSGGGKSTLLRILGGLLLPSGGQILIDGRRLPTRENELQAYRKEIGFVFQHGGLFRHLSAVENITLPLVQVHGVAREEAYRQACALLARFGLEQDKDKRPAELSGGQQQRVSIARAISAKPKFLLLDEPTSALDPEYTAEVLNSIHELQNDGMQMIIVTHEMGFARHACEKVAFLCDGKLMEYGESSRLFSNPQTPQLQRFLGKLLEWNV